MIDSIKNPFQGQTQVHNDRRNEPAATAGDTTSSSRSDSRSDVDRVDLSASARTLQVLEQRVNEATSVDTSRVEALKSSIDSGSYTVEPNRIAAALIRESQSS